MIESVNSGQPDFTGPGTNPSDDDAISDNEHRLISSARIEGTPVFDKRAEKVGTVRSVMIDKRSGQVAYAVLSFGGVLGFGSRVYPLPWSMLTYDPEEHGYSLEIGRDDIDAAPYMTLDEADRPHRTQEPAYRYWDMFI
ncbi:MAG: photosystem reaction center protein [Sphingomonas bacterium]|nr:photosystem reaction center protein [Sphingomonas bacterium]MDB5718221.1 photosystem reaction center protein [Sphingomonas bacterium]